MNVPRGLGQTTAEIQAMIVAAADQLGVPENIALGIASHESGFNPNAENHNSNGTTDWGVMQLNDTTVQTMGVSNPLDPQQNINAGVQLLANLLAQYGGNVYNALWAYASGSGNVGPGKTPNTIAANFIAYVMNYSGGTPSAPGSSSGGASPTVAPASTPCDPASDPNCTGTDASGNPCDPSTDPNCGNPSPSGGSSGSSSTTTIIAVGIAALVGLWVVSRLFD
jgi:hypothetical protein